MARVATSRRRGSEIRSASRLGAATGSSKRRMPVVPVILTLALVTGLAWQSATPQRALASLNQTALTSGSNTWGLQDGGFTVSSVSCPTTTQCYASGDTFAGGAVASSSGGTWSAPTLISGVQSLTGISCPTTTTCFASGMSTSSSLIVAQSISGGTWTTVSVPTAMHSLQTITCPTASTCLVGGTTPDPVYTGVFDGAVDRFTVSGGVDTWASAPSIMDGSDTVVSISCTSTSADFCGAIDSQLPTATAYWHTTDNGISWTAGSNPPNPNNHAYEAISCQPNASSTTCVAVGETGEIALTTTAGSSWSPVSLPSGPSNANLVGVSCASASQCMAIGSQTNYCGYGCTWNTPYAASITTSGPTTAAVNMSSNDSQSEAAVNSINCASVSSCTIGGSFGLETDTNGGSFMAAATEVPAIADLSCGYPNDCLGVTTTGSIVATNNGGGLWLNMPALQVNNCQSNGCDIGLSVTCSGPADCLIVVGQTSTYVNLLYQTTNLGVSWQSIASPAQLYSCALSSTTCVGIDNQGRSNTAVQNWTANVSTVGGGSWSAVVPTTAPSDVPDAISCGSATTCFAVGNGGGAELITETGSTWSATPVSMGTSAGINAVSCPTSTYCMAAGVGTVFSISISGTSTTVTPLTGGNIPGGNLNAVACDTALTCSVFGNSATSVDSGAQTTNGGSSFTAIPALPAVNGTVLTAACGGVGFCYAAGSITDPASLIGSESPLVLSTNGITSPALLSSSPILQAELYGGPDGSQPCFACALKAAGLSPQGFDGDPVNTADGDYTESLPIVSIPGLGPDLSFAATYDSQFAQAEVSSGATSPGPLGWGWSANDSMNLVIGANGTVTVDEEGGAQIGFTSSSAGMTPTGSVCSTSGTLQCFTASNGDVTAILEETVGTPDSYQFTRDNGRTTYSFNASGQLSAITDANGHTETFAYGITAGSLCNTSGTACNTETDSSSRVLTIVYATATKLISSVVDPAGRSWSFSYDSNKNLIGITNPRTQVVSLGYDTGSANPTMVHDLTSLTLPNGQSTGPYPGAQVTNSYEESSTSSQAPLGYLIAQSDAASTYQVAHSTSPNGITTDFSYSGNSMGTTGTTTITTTTGSSPSTVDVSEDNYVQGVMVSHVDGVNTTHPETTSFVRNSLDLPTSVIDGNGNTTNYTYDGNGNLLTSTDALSNTWAYTYNQFNQLLTATPPTGSTAPETVNTYDSAGNIQTSAQHPSTGSDLTTSYYYVGSPAGLPSSVKDPRGNSTLLTYDTYGDLATSTDPNGDKTTHAYTSIGQLFCSTSPKATGASVVCPSSPSTRVANTTSATFDSSDTLVATSTDPNGKTTTYGYDPNGNQTSVQDPLTNSTVTVFDADDRPASVTGGSGSSAQTVTTTAYDVAPAGTGSCLNSVSTATSCTVVTQASGTSIASTTSYYGDAFGNQIESVDPGGLITSGTYDQANNQKTATTGAGTTTYGYLANNWLSTEAFSGATAGFSTPSSSTTFTYFNDGARHTMADSSGTSTYTYDAYGRLKKLVNGAGNLVAYKYNADGSPTCISYPNSGSSTCLNASSGTGIIAYTYDTSNRMSSLTDWNSKQITFGYNANSDWSGTTYPTTASTSVADTIGNADNLTKETVTNANLSGGSQSTTWTPNGNELFASTKANSGTANSYGYNALSQVTSLANSDTYAYDQLGRMTSDTPSGSSAVNSGYSTDSALCWSGTGSPTGATCTSPPTGSTMYAANAINARCYSTTSTATGSCTAPPSSSTTQSYGYDQLGNLTCVTVPNASNYSCASPNSASTSTYAYNGDGLRTSDTPAGSSTQQFTWDVTQSTPNLLADGTNSYLYGPGGVPVEQIVTSTSTASYLVSDPTGVRYQFTVAGTVTGSASYGPYGKCISCTISTPFGFEDGYKDPTGLIYLINRYYDPATEQFISVDPLVSVTGQPFSYANGNPVNGSDPSGLDFWSDVSSVATVVAVVAVVATVTVTTAGVGDVVIAGAGGAIAGGISGSGLATAGLVTAGGAASVALGSDLAQEFQSSAGSFPSSVLQTRKSGKEKANDLPSWVNPEECQPQDGEKPVDVARRVVDNAPAGVSRGPGPRSPYNQIRKYVSKKYFGR